MIHRQNWLDVRSYLRYLDRVRQLSPETVIRARKHLRHLLEWADATPLTNAPEINPGLPTFLLSARSDGKPIPLAPASIKRCLDNVRGFFHFAREQWPLRYNHIKPTWIEFLQPPRSAGMASRLEVHLYYKLEDLLKIAAVSPETLRQQRAVAGACLLYLSGMRADALASLPISCVDIEHRELHQLPELGVRTKNRKAAITYLLEIPGLLDVVTRWDRRVRLQPPNTLWYSTLTLDGMALTPTPVAFRGRSNQVQKDLKIACRLAGVPYLSPHKMRHGHVMYALERVNTMAEFKAVSQNVMHASVTITDQVYGRLVDNDVRRIIGGLGALAPAPALPAGKISELIELLKQMQSV